MSGSTLHVSTIDHITTLVSFPAVIETPYSHPILLGEDGLGLLLFRKHELPKGWDSGRVTKASPVGHNILYFHVAKNTLYSVSGPKIVLDGNRVSCGPSEDLEGDESVMDLYATNDIDAALAWLDA